MLDAAVVKAWTYQGKRVFFEKKRINTKRREDEE